MATFVSGLAYRKGNIFECDFMVIAVRSKTNTALLTKHFILKSRSHVQLLRENYKIFHFKLWMLTLKVFTDVIVAVFHQCQKLDKTNKDEFSSYTFIPRFQFERDLCA